MDFDETYSPVARLTSLRIVFAIAAQLWLRVHQMDVDTAFLNAELTEDIYIKPPEGFPLPPGMNCFKLKRALYGLKQSPREWYNNIDTFLQKVGFKRLKSEACLYVRTDVFEETICIIALYVDDLLIAGSTLDTINQVKLELKEKYEMKDLGRAHHLLGCEVNHDEETGTTFLSQYQFTKTAVEKFLPEHSGVLDTPCDPSVNLSKTMCPQSAQERGEMESVPYRQAVGTLLWLSLGTRPDISYAVSQVAKYNENPGNEHWKAVKRIFRFLKGSMKRGLKFYGINKSNEFTSRFSSLRQLGNIEVIIFQNGKRLINEKDILEALAFVDANYARCIDTRRSVTGFIFFIGASPISWQSKQQVSTALNTMEAEYMAACAATQEAIWLLRVLRELGCVFTKPLTMYEDNQSCIFLSRNPGDFAKSKHIDTRYHFVREQVEAKTVILQKINTIENLADVFTKPLDRKLFYNITNHFMTETP